MENCFRNRAFSASCLFSCQIFEGNSNFDTPELRSMEPLVTRFIRIYPERATLAGSGLRFELLGCEIEGKQGKENECPLKCVSALSSRSSSALAEMHLGSNE